MTWGELRFLLQSSAPGVGVDLLDEFLKNRYTTILSRTDWHRLQAHSTVQTVAAYQSGSGSATLTIGSTGVTGSGTAFSASHVGRTFYRQGDRATYTVATYSSATSITLDRAYEGNGSEVAATVYAGCAFVVSKYLYSLPTDCASLVDVINPSTQLPMEQHSKVDLDAVAGSRATIGDPQTWAPYDDTTESSPPVLRQIELYPPPMYARGYAIHYRKNPTAFTGANTSSSPLPWVTATVLLAGCRADINAHLKDWTAADRYELQFQAELQLMVRENERTQPPRRMKMDPAYTRHRSARTTRGRRTWGVGQGGPY
jgi:hypothetical protein